MTLGTSSLKHSTLTRKRGAAAAGRLVTPGHDVCTAAAGVPSPSQTRPPAPHSQHSASSALHWTHHPDLTTETVTAMFLLLFDFTSTCPQLRCSISACAKLKFPFMSTELNKNWYFLNGCQMYQINPRSAFLGPRPTNADI